MGVIGDAWAAEPDLGNRDPNNLNDHLKVSFEELIGEPDHTHSIDCVWKLSYKCFNLWKALCYVIATTLCGIFIACGWGCFFACEAFQHIWYITPWLRAFELYLFPSAKIYAMICRNMCDPCCESCGKLFSAFKK